MMSYESKRANEIYAAAYEAIGVEIPEYTVLYQGDGYTIFRKKDGSIWFEDNNDQVELRSELKHPDYIKWDDSRGWIYKNGRDLPWKE